MAIHLGHPAVAGVKAESNPGHRSDARFDGIDPRRVHGPVGVI